MHNENWKSQKQSRFPHIVSDKSRQVQNIAEYKAEKQMSQGQAERPVIRLTTVATA